MPLNKEKRKLNKLIEQSDSDESEHELSHYVNDRIKLMKEVLKTVKPKKIKVMAPSCLRNTDIEEINSMLLEELLGISNKRLKYIFKGQSLDENSSSSTSEDKPIDVISLDDISDDDLVINIDDNDGGSNQKKRKREMKHHKCKKERMRNSTKQEKVDDNKGVLQGEEGIGSNKNLMSVLELLELQARARAIKSQLLLENAKTQESIAMSKIPTLEEKVGSDDEVIIKTAKTEEIVITSSESENEDLEKEGNKNENNASEETRDNILDNLANPTERDENKTDTVSTQDNGKGLEEELPKIKILENKEISNINEITIIDENIVQSNNDSNNKDSSVQNVDNYSKENEDVIKDKSTDNDGIIQINLSDDEMEELK